MIYTTMTVGEKELKLRLDMRSIALLEKAIGRNPLGMFTDGVSGDVRLPTYTEMLCCIHAALQPLEHGYNMEKVYDLMDEFVADGGTMEGMMQLVTDTFEASGLTKKQGDDGGDEVKNSRAGTK